MSMGGALEFIQSFNNPKIIDAPDSSLEKGKFHRRWKPLIILRDFLQLPKLFIEKEDKLISGALKVVKLKKECARSFTSSVTISLGQADRRLPPDLLFDCQASPTVGDLSSQTRTR